MKKVLVQFNFPNLTTKAYEKAWEDCRAAGYSNPKGLLHHVGAVQGKNILVTDTWESEAAFNKFGEVLMPILAKNGMAGVKPTILPVHYEFNGLEKTQSR